MATQVIEFEALPGVGSVKLFSPGGDSVVASGANITEKSNDRYTFRAEFEDVPAGTYKVKCFIGSAPINSQWVDLEPEDGVYISRNELYADAFTSSVLSGLQELASSGITGGAFPVELVIKTTNGAAIPQCDVVLTSSNASIATDVIWRGRAGVDGAVHPDLDPGTYYGWVQKPGYTFANPFTLVVAADGPYTVS